LRYPWDPAPEPEIPESNDDEFYDEEIEKLIGEKRFNDARKLLMNMLNVARDMRDEEAIKNLQPYDERIDEAEKFADEGR